VGTYVVYVNDSGDKSIGLHSGVMIPLESWREGLTNVEEVPQGAAAPHARRASPVRVSRDNLDFRQRSTRQGPGAKINTTPGHSVRPKATDSTKARKFAGEADGGCNAFRSGRRR
jgi:hypothetical protein